MMWTELLPAIGFVVFVGVVYVLAGAAAIRFWRQRDLEAVRAFDRIVLTFAALGLVCIGYGYFVEPYRLAITHVEIRSPKLAGKHPIRIVHFSDLHSDPRPRLEPRLPQTIAAEHPDIIVFTGDSINSADALPRLRECLSAVAKIAPTFVVRGNWDTGYWSGLDLFQGTGVRELNGDAVRLEPGGTPIWIAGLAYDNWLALDKTIDKIPVGEFSVLLYHSPDLIQEVAKLQVDLYLAGHTHGGQVALPLFGALITFSQFGKRYEAGLYREESTSLYVNRGIGMEGGFAPRVRFWSRPELTVIEIRSLARTP